MLYMFNRISALIEGYQKDLRAAIYGRKSADRTEHGNDVIFFLSLAIVFVDLEARNVKK